MPRYFQATWQEALLLCNQFGMEFAALNTLTEYEFIRTKMTENSHLFTEWTHIGAMAAKAGSSANTDWFWVETNEPLSYSMNWRSHLPDNANGVQFCLSIGPKNGNVFRFDDINCFGAHEEKFICQKDAYATHWMIKKL